MSEQKVDRILYSEEQILNRVEELGKQIAEDYYPLYLRDKEGFKLILIGVLKGCNPFMVDISRAIYKALEELHGKIFPSVYVDYISIKGRGSNNERNPLEWLLATRMDLSDVYGLIIEDIIHTGDTIANILANLHPQWTKAKMGKPISLEVCTFLDRVSKDKTIRAKYTGFELKADDWVVGYGMDSHEFGRLLPDIWSLLKL